MLDALQANHAEDQVIIFDLTFLKLVESVAPKLPGVKAFLLATDKQHMPHTSSIPNLYCYEELLKQQEQHLPFSWAVKDETAACGACYTSGTTGQPKVHLPAVLIRVLEEYSGCLLSCMATEHSWDFSGMSGSYTRAYIACKCILSGQQRFTNGPTDRMSCKAQVSHRKLCKHVMQVLYEIQQNLES